MGSHVVPGPRRLVFRTRHAIVIAACCAAVLAAGTVAGQGSRREPAGPRRPAPAGRWAEETEGTFLPNAFESETLKGQRPVFGPGGPKPGPPGTGAANPSAAATSTDGIAWSTLVSADTLGDEIKDRKSDLAAACTRATEFKGGGFERARDAFSSLALAFGVIAAYDADIRWKKDAALARDLFARAGFNCKVGTDQSFAESRARLEDLEALLDGNPPRGRPDRDEDFLWSQVAGRPALMNRLEAARDEMRSAMASRADFTGRIDRLIHAMEVTAAIGEVIRRPDFEHHDDETYRGHAGAMRDAAVEARAACEKKDYETARAAVGRLEKSCDACHGDYRS